MKASSGSARIGLIAAAAGLAMSGCDSSTDPAATGEAAVPAQPAAADAAGGSDPESIAHLEARVVAALVGLVASPSSARYFNLRAGSAGAICGEVMESGAVTPRPFVVTAEGSAAISTSPVLALANPADPFPDLYMRYCATAEELRRIGQTMETIVPVPHEIPIPPPAVPMPSAPEEEESAADPPAPPVRPRAAPAGDDDSFFNSVLRPERGARPRA